MPRPCRRPVGGENGWVDRWNDHDWIVVLQHSWVAPDRTRDDDDTGSTTGVVGTPGTFATERRYDGSFGDNVAWQCGDTGEPPPSGYELAHLDTVVATRVWNGPWSGTGAIVGSIGGVVAPGAARRSPTSDCDIRRFSRLAIILKQLVARLQQLALAVVDRRLLARLPPCRQCGIM